MREQSNRRLTTPIGEDSEENEPVNTSSAIIAGNG